MSWYEFSRFHPERYAKSLGIGFAFVATHNHFVLDRGGKVFKQTAPIIKLPAGTTEEDHLALIAWLNSSAVGFLARQSCSSKGAQGVNEGIKTESWEQFLEYAGGPISKLPVLPGSARAVDLAARLDRTAQSRDGLMPTSVRLVSDEAVSSASLNTQHQRFDRALEHLCALQEDLDFLCYEQLGLLMPEDIADVTSAAERCPRVDDDQYRIAPGHRPFELILSSTATSTHRPTAWFSRNGYIDPTSQPLAGDHPMRPLILARRAVIERNAQVRLIEQPEYKRRWTLRDWSAELRDAATRALLDAAERESKRDPSVRSARDLTDAVLRDARLRAIAAIRFPDDDNLPARLADLLVADAVPFLTAARFTPDGLAKHALWQHTWSLQRREDAGETLTAPIPVPPKYDREDYLDPRYWSLRGRLDVPRERFIAYPFATTDDDPSPLYGWAGWDHRQRADALAALYQRRRNDDGWTADRLTPLLAGLLELIPWLRQWHNEPAPGEDQGAGDAYAAFVASEARALGLTLDALASWRPPTKSEARAAAASKRARAATAPDIAVAADDTAVTDPTLPTAKPRAPRRKKPVASADT